MAELTRSPRGKLTARLRRPGVSVRLRITLTVAILVGFTLASAGLIVRAVELRRLDENAAFEIVQEFREFDKLREEAEQGTTDFPDLNAMFRTFLERNVPDDDELMIGWIGEEAGPYFPDDPLVRTPDERPGNPEFWTLVNDLIKRGGTGRMQTTQGEILVSTQPVEYRRTGENGALVVVIYLAEDRQELYDTLRTYAIVAILSLGLVTAVAFWRSGRLLAPLRTLRDTAEEISETDLSLRLPVTGRDDITALTITVNGMLDRLESAFVGQRQFLDDAGHELKTPLTVLRGHLELLDVDNPAEVTETRELLLDEVDRMSRLVGDLILLAKSDRPDFVTHREVELAGFTEDVLSKARALGDRDWQLDGTGSGLVEVDDQRLTQAMLQLADNAVKHTAAGDVIAIGSTYDGRRAQLWVRDTGPGVPDAARHQIFERFGRGHVPDGDEGFGLGLSIVSAIAQSHHGSVSLDLTWTGGAKFVISLPGQHREPDPTHEGTT